MHLMRPTGEAQTSQPKVSISWAALELPYAVDTSDRLAVSWAALEIQNQSAPLNSPANPSA